MIYEPAEDSFLLQKALPKYAKGKHVLDMCAGSGIQSETARKAGAKSVLAVDINSEAVESLTKKGITALRSDLFEKVTGTFDLIICNPPYLPRDSREDKESEQITSGGKNGDELILKFLSQSSSFLEPKGKILLVLSSLTPRGKILSLLKRKALKAKVILHQALFMEQLEVWEITRAQ